jgi:membrane fusion protein
MAALFREEALASVGAPKLGPVVLASALSHWLMAGFAALVVATVACALLFGRYVRHVEIAGRLQPQGGDVKVYLPRPGVVERVMHAAGEQVRKGDVLLRFTTEHEGAAGSDLETLVLQQSHVKLDSLRAELNASMRLQAPETSDIQSSVANTQAGRSALVEEAHMLEARIASATATVVEHEQLKASGFETEQFVRQRRDEVVELQLRLASVHRELAATDEELAHLKRSEVEAPLKMAVERAQIEQSIAAVQGELARQETDHEWSVTAPCDGTILSVNVGDGQTAVAGSVLISLRPRGAPLQARLYAPSRDAGFIKPGQHLRLKVDAFPFQKFGTLPGRIIAIAGAPLSAGDLASSGLSIGTRSDSGEPLYAIDVALDAQSFDAYGEHHPLVSGMQLTGDVPLDTRRLYEWVLEPLYAMRHA